MVLIMRLDKENLYQWIKSQGNSALASLNDSGGNLANPYNGNNEEFHQLSEVFSGFSFEILLHCYLLYFLSQKFKLKWLTNYASTVLRSNFPCNNYFYIAIFSLHESYHCNKL